MYSYSYCSSQVLGTRRLLHVNFEEFEAEMGAADQLFSKWDEECERLMSTLREIAKKKREDIKTHAGRLNLAHKRLQTRLENLKKCADRLSLLLFDSPITVVHAIDS